MLIGSCGPEDFETRPLAEGRPGTQSSGRGVDVGGPGPFRAGKNMAVKDFLVEAPGPNETLMPLVAQEGFQAAGQFQFSQAGF